jgi:nucleoside-specific outer membrane channel protein Tsx
MVKQRFLLVLFAVLLLASPASAKYFWQDFNVSLLGGSAYRIPYDNPNLFNLAKPYEKDEARTVFTFEHCGETDFGDTFMFVDYMWNNDGDTEIYGELNPRISIGKSLNKDLSNGIIQDYFLSYCYEFGNNFYSKDSGQPNGQDNHFRNHLFGFGINFKIKGFTHFKIDYFLRANGENAHPTLGNPAWKNQQITFVWGYPFSIGDAEFVYDGFVDYTTPETDSRNVKHYASTNFTSQLKWNLGKAIKLKNHQKNKLYLGVEYVYWNNKFGIKDGAPLFTGANRFWDSDERNVNVLLQYHF